MKNSIKYLSIMIDSHLNWKSQLNYISKKIERNIGILSNLRHYVNLKTLTTEPIEHFRIKSSVIKT